MKSSIRLVLGYIISRLLMLEFESEEVLELINNKKDFLKKLGVYYIYRDPDNYNNITNNRLNFYKLYELEG